ncbi:hypothetical protein ETAE_0425 [Edwardsiella piscicida]|uniref:Uncharacterized protein n=1 Tax=Edwardsiella piscicida TaxID=1263550 RepID=A0AAU8P7W5_EDWPI|nr:hypothetical protein ETAE_0425 [Edwardsiella tarda EIB202]
MRGYIRAHSLPHVTISAFFIQKIIITLLKNGADHPLYNDSTDAKNH